MIYLPALEPLLHDAPANILKYVVAQYSKVRHDQLSKSKEHSIHVQVLPNDPASRRLFVTSGGLKKIQEIKPEPGSALREHIDNINACYPEEIVRYYTPGYSEQLLQRVDSFKPSDSHHQVGSLGAVFKSKMN